MALTNCSMCYLPLPEHEVVSHVSRNHKFDPNFIVYCNQPGCGASYKIWSSFQKHVKREHHMNFNNIDDEDIVDVPEPYQDEDIVDIPESYQDEKNRQDLLRWHASMFIINLKESCSIPQTTVEKVIDGAQQLITEFMSIIKAMILNSVNEETRTVSRADILQVFASCDVLDLFHEVSSSARIKSFLDKCGMVRPEKQEIWPSRVWTKEAKFVTRKDYAYVVPFLRNLKFYLHNDDVLSCVDNPKPYDGTIRTILDGSYYRSHKIFKRDKKALSIIVYYDDVEFANPLGAKTRKLSIFYWTLGNVYPELRSSLRSINLLAITSHANVKKHGAEKVVSDFLNDLALLGNEDGISLKIKDVQRKFTGFLNFVAGDTPAYLGGFKEGVANAHRPCRTCFADKQSIQERFSEELFVIRNMETHTQHCEDVYSPGLNKQARGFWSTFYGVNFKSALMNVDNINVTKIFPHDFRHIMFEGGTLAVEIKNFLIYCIVENKRFTLQDLNAIIANFAFDHLVQDKPSPIEP
ncbi:hypothetical protein DMN91_011899 [Ooceraea biroi]|uniref:C2H2-type domain-containing protein n=1 Tax=Ooceraea biroi TaxID=2015173 RepID=A0A3L8D6T3_OOCBI|nr:uncharacterized protein LOC105284310 [Ooceraea biroi]RLU16140.1 hypothetical protein DMN91_011899 [Ooceraea biroi]